MDEQTQEEIARAISSRLSSIITLVESPNYHWEQRENYIREHTEFAMKDILQALTGYRKLPEGKPPLLNDREIWAVTNYEPNKEEPLTLQDGRKVAQAQKDSDIKWYGGKE